MGLNLFETFRHTPNHAHHTVGGVVELTRISRDAIKQRIVFRLDGEQDDCDREDSDPAEDSDADEDGHDMEGTYS